MVAAFDYCLHGQGGAAPSIDTAMHALVDADHVDHLHPDSGIALATAVDGEALTKECFGDRVAWVPWRRPGFQLGLDIAAIKEHNPAAIGVDPRRSRHHGVGRYERGVRGATRWRSSARAAAFLSRAGRPRAVRRGRARLRAAAGGRAARPGRPRWRPSSAGAGVHRSAPGRALHRQRRRARLLRARPSWPGWPRSARRAPTTSCARRSARSCSTSRRPRPARRRRRPPARAARRVPRRLPRLLRAPRRRRTRRRCAAPIRRSCSSPASACSPTARRSRRRGSPASSTSTPST